eukprot:355353-Chlamydomonas_euryale.AAC.9
MALSTAVKPVARPSSRQVSSVRGSGTGIGGSWAARRRDRSCSCFRGVPRLIRSWARAVAQAARTVRACAAADAAAAAPPPPPPSPPPAVVAAAGAGLRLRRRRGSVGPPSPPFTVRRRSSTPCFMRRTASTGASAAAARRLLPTPPAMALSDEHPRVRAGGKAGPPGRDGGAMRRSSQERAHDG